MSSPNVGYSPQPDDALILRGSLQIDTALKALEVTETNPDLQEELRAARARADIGAQEEEEYGISLHYTWVRSGEKGKQARSDVLAGLTAAESATQNPELAIAASALKALLTAK